MDLILLIPAGLLFFIGLINFMTVRNPWDYSQIDEKLSIHIPLRNEESNVQALLENLSQQKYLSNAQFFFLDDNSEDDTFKLLEQFCERVPNFHLLSGAALPQGWIGKTWALQQLLNESRGEIVVTIDADVRLQSDAISKAVNLLKSTQLDFLSPYPAQLAHTWSEKLIQPLLQWSWFSTVILRFAERSSMSSTVVANGQFFVVRRSVLEKIGGYRAVANKVLDDVALGRELVKSGSHGTVANGSLIASTRMYSSWAEIQAGYGKSLHSAFGSLVGSLIAITFLFVTGIAPLIAGITGSEAGWYAFAAVTLTRTMSAIKAGKSGLDGFLHPISSALLIYLIIYSWLMRGHIQWKGRTV